MNKTNFQYLQLKINVDGMIWYCFPSLSPPEIMGMFYVYAIFPSSTVATSRKVGPVVSEMYFCPIAKACFLEE